MRFALRFCVCALVFPLLGAAPVWAASRSPTQALVQHVTQQLRAQVDPARGKLGVTVAPLRTQRNLSCQKFEPFAPVKLRARVSLPVRCLAPQPWQIYVTVHLTLSGKHYLATRTIAPGDRVGAHDVRGVQGDLLHLPSGVVTDSTQLIGRIATQRIPSGSMMKSGVLRDPDAIQRGQRIRIETRGAGFVMHTEGQALQSGVPGSLIQIRAASGQLVHAVVVDATRAQVPL